MSEGDNLEKILNKIKDNQEAVIIYGAGVLSHLTLKSLLNRKLAVKAFCDLKFEKFRGAFRIPCY
jgi:hypothetical protein